MRSTRRSSIFSCAFAMTTYNSAINMNRYIQFCQNGSQDLLCSPAAHQRTESNYSLEMLWRSCQDLQPAQRSLPKDHKHQGQVGQQQQSQQTGNQESTNHYEQLSEEEAFKILKEKIQKDTTHCHLWIFLFDLLMDSSKSTIASWEDHRGMFRIKDPNKLALLWGVRRNRANMTYEKLSRSLRHYYEKKILRKVPKRKYTYKFNSREILKSYDIQPFFKRNSQGLGKGGLQPNGEQQRSMVKYSHQNSNGLVWEQSHQQPQWSQLTPTASPVQTSQSSTTMSILAQQSVPHSYNHSPPSPNGQTLHPLPGAVQSMQRSWSPVTERYVHNQQTGVDQLNNCKPKLILSTSNITDAQQQTQQHSNSNISAFEDDKSSLIDLLNCVLNEYTPVACEQIMAHQPTASHQLVSSHYQHLASRTWHSTQAYSNGIPTAQSGRSSSVTTTEYSSGSEENSRDLFAEIMDSLDIDVF